MYMRFNNLIGSKKRIWELDALRGLAVLLMIFDHFMIDISMLPAFFSNFFSNADSWVIDFYNLGNYYVFSHIREAGHYIFAFLFILITGVSCHLSSSNFMRAVELAVVSMGITIAFSLFSSFSGGDSQIIFGILHCLTISIFLYIIIKKIFKKDIFLLFFGAIIIFVGIMLPWYDYTYIYTIEGATWGETLKNVLDVVLGLKCYGEDYFGLIPSAGVLLVGAYIGSKFYNYRKSLLPSMDGSWNAGLTMIGRHALIIYILHQLIIPLLIVFVGVINGFTIF